MPPQGRGRGGRAGWGAGRAGSAASADPGAGPSTSGRSGPASQLSLLPVPLLRAYRALPAAAEALLPAPVTQRPGGGSSAAGRGRGAGSGRLAALREAKEQLRELGFAVTDLSHLRQPEQAAALAELLSTHPAETAALLRLYSSALRPDGEERAGGESGSGSGSGGGGSPGEALALEGWRADVSSVVAFLIYRLRPLPANRHALSALRFLLALLRAQTLQAFSRRLASAAKAAASGGGGGSAFMKRMLSMQPGEGARLAMAALHCGRHLLGRQREVSPPWLAAQRQEWWRLAACTVVHGIWAMDGDAQTWLWEVVTDRLTVMGPKASIVKPVKVQGCCRFDLDALPPAPPPEVAAALAAGLLPALAALPDLPRSGPANPRGPFAELLTACNRDRPDGSGLALFLAPLLAYGEPGQAEGLLGALGRAGGLVGPSGGGAGTDPFREAATSLLGALAGALQRCRGLGVAAAEAAEESLEAAAGPVEAAEGSRGGYGLEAKAGAVGSGGPSGAVPPPPPLQQLRRLLAIAAELWGLPLPAQPAAVVEKGDASA
ncbi:hypothetical protein HYH03_003811 [Edaphochlamys debaryana]|uniref:Uncharacterized protein n=1 Tax=Edaphochlamys debaryana TaxID=47281 RepID=A0A835YG07_9CHLO|nr:hypothetical protein HYH03_003811 [Edaphochlamys debaryana]|eukprot:KAG2498050.1 hypothetical protein HYH03_003811 [Edaphochlamys debaryana]